MEKRKTSEWINTFQGVALAYEYDAVSYMNSRMYVSRFDQATWFLLHAIGLNPNSMKERNLRFAIVRQNFQFLRELRGGELITIRSGFLAVGKKYFRFLHQMHDDQGHLIATCDIVGVQADLSTGASVKLAEDLQSSAQKYLVTENSTRSLPDN